MENLNHSNQNCGCSEGCCTPQKKGNLWKRVLFIFIILSAGTIVTVKLAGKQNTPPAACCATESPACCAEAQQNEIPAACCATPASTPCCSQPEK